MPEWLIPALNETALVVIVAFFLWGTVRVARFLAPLITDYAKARITMAEDMQLFIQERIKVGEFVAVSIGDIQRGVVRTEKCLDAIMAELNLPPNPEDAQESKGTQ
jgi:hypothetical protein